MAIKKEPSVEKAKLIKASKGSDTAGPIRGAHWSTEVFNDPIKDDFRVFLTLLWAFLGLQSVTPLQLSIAYHLQHHGWDKEIDRQIVMAFRGAAKSWITAGYVLWRILRNPQLKIGVVSGSGKRAVMFVQFCLKLIDEWPLLHHLQPKANQKQSSTGFDVGPATPDQTPSIWSAGITSQIVGYRADIIVFDDIETNTNSLTKDMQEKLTQQSKEFESIIKPGGQLLGLGTPQTESSIYLDMLKRGYSIQIWPARFPTGVQERRYGDRLSKYIKYQLDHNPHIRGLPTEPSRFSDEDLASRETAIGKSTFALQFMLDTTLADVGKFPLRLGDTICMGLDFHRGPDWLSWGSGTHLEWNLNVIGFEGDRLYKPASVSETSSKWQTVMGFVDPSGRGTDETTLTIGGVLHSTPFLLKQAGWTDGYAPATLEAIAALCVRYGVNMLRVEEDFGQGMFAELLKPYITRVWDLQHKRALIGPQTALQGHNASGGTEVVSERTKRVQKELRILETLEPIIQSHRLVASTEVWEDDWNHVSSMDGTDYSKHYSLMYQLTHLTREPKCLPHDDRIDGVGGLVQMMLEHLGQDPEKAAKNEEERRWSDWFDKMMDEESGLLGEGPYSRPALRGNLRTGTERSLH